MAKQPIIFKDLPFDAGHRVMMHESKCRSPHGHRWVARVFAQGKKLDEVGRVIDFSVLKEKIGAWIDLNWDHAFIVNQDDAQLIKALNSVDAYKPIFILPSNPTVENMAQYLLDKVCPKLMKGTGINIVKVQMWETPTSSVEVIK
jgi:6-pyruvoyltetrahydropterin/6-carboxytetrahydropterin synthase